jgi:hypothetical protein
MIMTNCFLRRYFILLVFMLPWNSLWAGDEAMFTPYTQIDPETGFSITIEQPATEHAMQNPGESVVLNKPGAATPVIEDAPVSAWPANQTLAILTGIAFLTGGLYLWHRKSRPV